MALPTILVNSATGSDSAASGAGPSTALTGVAGVTSADGLTVTLDGSPDLTNVATDGSHVLFMSDTNAGSRNFSKITGTANSGTPTAQVTVADAFQGLNTDAWAIGGKRASIGSTTSRKLFTNNGGNGDWMPGWIVEMQSGHAETISATIDLRRSGDTTSGRLVLRGAFDAAVRPAITISANTQVFITRGVYQSLVDFDIVAASSAVTSAVTGSGSSLTLLSGLKLSRTATNVFVTGFVLTTGDKVVGCEIQRCTTGITSADAATIQNNYIHDCTGNGITMGGGSLGPLVTGNIIYACAGDGINWGFTGDVNRSGSILNNTIDSCTGDGIEISGAANTSYNGLRIENNILSNNGAYGVKLSAVSAAQLSAYGPLIVGNQTYNNTSGAYSDTTSSYAYNACPWASGDNNLDPQFTNTASGDFSIGANLKAKGYPLGGTLPVGGSATYSYVDPGAAQRQEAGGGAGNKTRSKLLG